MFTDPVMIYLQDHLELVYSHPAGFRLRSQYYILSWGKSSNISDMILGSYTTREDREARFDNRKNFQIPARVALGGSRTHHVKPVDGFNM